MPDTGGVAYDVVILGAGSAAEELCSALAERGDSPGRPRRVAVVERDLVGGECPFLACMPSKAMLRSARIRRLLSSAGQLGGAAEETPLGPPAKAYAAAVRRRDKVAEGRDDSSHVEELARANVDLIRGTGRITAPGMVEVTGGDGSRSTTLRYGTLVLATGSSPVVPPIPGLASVSPWTSDDALTADELPASLLVLGGGPVGCELAEVFASFGTRVVLVESGDRLLEGGEEAVSARLERHLRAIGVDVRTGINLESVSEEGDAISARLSDGTTTRAERVLVAAGRRARSEGLGLERVGIVPDEEGGAVDVDDQCRVQGAENLYAIGDLNGVAPYTHAAKAQARVVAAALCGEEAASYDSEVVPRCVYTHPPVAAVGLTAREARSRGHEVVVAEMELGETARAVSDGRRLDDGVEEGSSGVLVLVGDAGREVLLGASACGPRAEEWIGEAVLAIMAGVSLRVLAGVVHPFPSYAEAVEPAYRDLLARCRK